MKKNKELFKKDYNDLIEKIAQLLNQARTKVVKDINRTQVITYWHIGKEIVEFEQKGKMRAEYGKELLVMLSADMINRFGRGFSLTNLKMMRLFYRSFPIRQTLSDELDEKQKSHLMPIKPGKSQTPSDQFKPLLSWSCYCELLKIEEPLARSFYEQEAVQSNWSVRELKRQINSMLFERLALSKDAKAVMKMAQKGQLIEKPEDVIKDPYILEFLNLKEETSYTESQLEQAITDKLQYFLLEMGKGFSFVARQKRITIANRHYYIDLVFLQSFFKVFYFDRLENGRTGSC